jgi:uncharacterized protein YndB with AHSA1/START domain
MTTQPKFPVVRLQRTLPAPPREVFHAWLEPALLRQWMAPGFEATHAEVDPRVGGHFRIWHADTGADVGGFEAEILELVPDRRIVFRWGFVGPQRTAGPVYDSLLTITLEPAPGNASHLTLLHERLDDLAAAMPQGAAKVETGWRLVLDKLALALAAARQASMSGQGR